MTNLNLKEQTFASTSNASYRNCLVKGSDRLSMKKLALVATILLAGCASSNTWTTDSDPRLVQLEKKRRALDESEQQCIDQTLTRTRDEMARIAATADASVESQTQRENDERDREISQCRAWMDQENAEIAEQERNEYELQAQQERNRASFIAIVTTSRMH